jgi:hypothetical protein
MKIIQDSVVQIGNFNAVLTIAAFCPTGNEFTTNDYESIMSLDKTYIIKPDMVSNINFLNYITHKLTYCNMVIAVPNADKDRFKEFFLNNYSYVFINLVLTKDSKAKTSDAIEKKEKENADKPFADKDTYSYGELFLVNTKKLVAITSIAAVYSLSLVSANWWKFHTNIHYSTHGLKLPASTILKTVYNKAGLQLDTKLPGYLDSTFLEYSSCANDNILTIESYIRQKIFNLNNLDNTFALTDANYNCIVIYDTLNSTYKTWSKPTISAALTTIQKGIQEITVSTNKNTVMTTDNQGILTADTITPGSKTTQYLKQRESIYQTYDYDTDNMYYNVLSQILKQKIFLNDNEITKDDMISNLLYPYDNLTVTINSNANINANKPIHDNCITVIPDVGDNRYALFSSTSNDNTNISEDLEFINFNTDTIIITMLPTITFNVGQVVYVKFVTDNDIAKTTESTYSLYNNYYMIKSINLALGLNKIDAVVLTLSKYCLS